MAETLNLFCFPQLGICYLTYPGFRVLLMTLDEDGFETILTITKLK